MKNYQKHLQTLSPVAYSLYMCFKTPTMSDGVIVFSLCAVAIMSEFISKRFFSPRSNPEIDKLEEELKIERIKATIDQLKSNALKDKTMRDSRSALSGFNKDKEIRF